MPNQTITLNENTFVRLVAETALRLLNEIDWKTYANASKTALGRGDYNRANSFANAATDRFREDFVYPYNYDTMGDKWKGRHSATFDARINPYGHSGQGTVKGRNRGGDTITSFGPGDYDYNGTPGQFFRDREVADRYKAADDEAWKYYKDKYRYEPGNGWTEKDNEALQETAIKVLRDMLK